MLKTMETVIKVRCTTEEKARVTRLAQKAKLTLSDYVRTKLEVAR